MKITKENDELVVRIPLQIEEFDVYSDDSLGLYDNVVGVIAGHEQGVYSLNHLTYKGATQLGAMLVGTWMENEEFKTLCSTLGIRVWEFPTCCECNKVLWNTFTIDSRGEPMCLEHLPQRA